MASNPLPSDWTSVHDLALVYLALMHGADDDIDPAEWTVVMEKLRAWFPDEHHTRIEQIVEEVLLVYMGSTQRPMLEAAAASLRQEFGKAKRISILNDLADIASADGAIVQGEVSFIQELARYWDVERDITG